MIVAGLHAVASAAFERMVFSLAEGLLLTGAVALALRLVPAKASQTRFAIWLAAMFGIVAVTLFGSHGAGVAHSPSAPSLFTLPISFALSVFVLWIALTMTGLLRIVLGLCQLRSVRRQCKVMPAEDLPADVRELIESFQKVRRVSLLRSDDSQTPKAIGFFHAAIILPAWLMDEGTPEQLKHVLLHELAHLRRRDDWTNLFQQVVKAFLFFHPAIWWMERELSLSREQACDDAALEHTTDARDYARSLALVAEKSFLRRQIALAQAVIGHAHQLTQRVTRILDPKRPVGNRAWKPAVPLVAVAAAVCGFSTSWTPALVKIQDAPAMSAHAVRNISGSLAVQNMNASESAAAFGVKAWPASATVSRSYVAQPSAKGSNISAQNRALKVAKHRTAPMNNKDRNERMATPSLMAGAMSGRTEKAASPMVLAATSTDSLGVAGNRLPAAAGTGEKDTGEKMVLLVATQQTIVAGPNGWQVEVSQVRWVVPAKALHKPVPPRKT